LPKSCGNFPRPTMSSSCRFKTTRRRCRPFPRACRKALSSWMARTTSCW
jgi:hypothetical protein